MAFLPPSVLGGLVWYCLVLSVFLALRRSFYAQTNAKVLSALKLNPVLSLKVLDDFFLLSSSF